jgi:imidazole glycerol-phosphate synthase subunit HisF
MLKARVIPILTFNGFGLVKTKQFDNPRMVGNPVQSARVYNSRGVDELIFLDITASKQKRKINFKLVADVIKECYMPIGIGGGIETIADINNLLKIGADKVVIKTKAIFDKDFIRNAVRFFGSQCISISIDVKKKGNVYEIYHPGVEGLDVIEFIKEMESIEVGEFVLNSVDRDGMMSGFDIDLVNLVLAATQLPVIVVGGGGEPEHYADLFTQSETFAVGSASIFHFTQYTPLDIKRTLAESKLPVRI